MLNVYQSFTLAITFATPLISSDYIIVNVPGTYRYIQGTLLTTSICSNTNYTCILESENQFKVTGSFNSTSSVSITVLDNCNSINRKCVCSHPRNKLVFTPIFSIPVFKNIQYTLLL